jgi:hypothetical protein
MCVYIGKQKEFVTDRIEEGGGSTNILKPRQLLLLSEEEKL